MTHRAGADLETGEGIRVDDTLLIPRGELDVRASRSSGAGGQHVNKTSSRIEISWNIAGSRVITDEQRDRLLDKLASRLSDDGAIRIVASETRSQLRNREAAERRLAETIGKALVVPKKRKPTRRPRAADEARLTEKKKHSERKRERKRPITD
jgi:ribosome-associated protein